MKAVVFHGIGDIRLDNVKDPTIQKHFDAIVQLTASAICGTDLHFVRGTVPGRAFRGHGIFWRAQTERTVRRIASRACTNSVRERWTGKAPAGGGR